MDTELEFGPAMAALSEMRRLFVLALVNQEGRPNLTAAAKAAGYATASYGSLRHQAHSLAHDPRIIAALHEEAQRRFPLFGLFGVKGLAAIAANPKHPEHYKANRDLADRFGFAVVSEHKVTVERKDTNSEAVIEQIRALALELGVDPARLVGANTIDGDFKVLPAPEKAVEGGDA